MVVLDCHNHSSVALWSDRSGSVVEDPPLFDVLWGIVSDSQSVVVCTDMLVVENSSVTSHDRFDLESNSISEWVSWELDSSIVDEELLTASSSA